MFGPKISRVLPFVHCERWVEMCRTALNVWEVLYRDCERVLGVLGCSNGKYLRELHLSVCPALLCR